MIPRRTIVKVGDIFDIVGHPQYRLQVVAKDINAMESDVVAVINKKQQSSIDDEFEDIKFYVHTYVSEGVKDGMFIKVGNFPVTFDISKFLFKNFYDEYHNEIVEGIDDAKPEVPYPNWTVWSPADDQWRYITQEEGISTEAEDGSIYPTEDIIYRIVHGKSEFRSNWPS